MTEKALETLSDDQLLSMVLPDIPSVGNYTDDELMNLAQSELLDSIDTKSGADAGVSPGNFPDHYAEGAHHHHCIE